MNIFFTYLLGLCTSFENCLLKYYAHLLMGYLFWYLIFRVLDINQMNSCQISSHPGGCLYSGNYFLCCAAAF